MEFTPNIPIYVQIADFVCVKITQMEWLADKRIPSIRELAFRLGVNPNTVLKSYELLEQKKLIINRRGNGFFVLPTACQRLVNENKRVFIYETLPRLFAEMKDLEIDIEEVIMEFNSFKRTRGVLR